VGKREDLSDVVYLSDVKKTPLLSMARKGERLNKQLLFEYQVKKLGDRKPGGVPDGKDVDAFDANQPRALIQARGEVFRRAPRVGFIAVGNTVAGVPNEFDAAVQDQLTENKRDMEKEMFSIQESNGDDGVNGSKFRALGRYVNAGELAFNELPIPAAFRTPVGQVYTGVFGDGINTGLTEPILQGTLQARWEATGDSGDLTGFVSATIKNRFGTFSQYQANIANTTVIWLQGMRKVEGKTLYGPSIDVYQSDWGTFRLIPVNIDFLPSQYYGYMLDMSQVAIRDRGVGTEQPLPNMGGGPVELIQSIIGPEWGDPRSHVKIACSGA
jgi:hypothetical protein